MMKTSAIILLTILMLACSTSKKTVETVAVETEKVENKIGTIKKIIKKLIQFKILKYELLGSILNDHNSLSILIDLYIS